MDKELVDNYISEAVREVIKKHHESYRDMAQKLNMSYGYFRQLMAGNKNFMPSKLYLISRVESVPINKLFPPTRRTPAGFSKYEAVTGDTSKRDFEQFLHRTGV